MGGIYLLFLGKFLGGEYSGATFPDNTHFMLPLFAHISKSFASGQYPYWVNSIAGGIPIYNNPQFSLLYPFYFFKWDLYHTPVDTLMRVHYVALLHIAILWCTTYVMMRVFHLRILSSILGATLFAFCANTYLYLFWINIVSPYSWLPLALASVLLILENTRPKTGLVMGWVSIYLMCSASPAQPLIHFSYCTALLTVSYGIIHRRNTLKLREPLRNLILLAVGSILLCSATLIPTIVFSRTDMVRWTEAGPIVGNQRIPFKGFLTGQAKPTELAKILFPIQTSQVTGDSYFGIIPIFLAAFALFRRRKNWIILPLFILCVYALLSSTGSHLGFAYINYRLPLWNKIREPARHLYLFALAASFLAAVGFEHLTEFDIPKKLRQHAFVLGSFLVLLGAGYWIRQHYETLISDSTLLTAFALFLAVLALVQLFQISHVLVRIVLAAVMIYPAVRYPVPILKIHDGDYYAEANLSSHRVLQALAKIEDIGKYRTVIRDTQLNPQFWSMNASYYGLRTFEAFMNPLPFGEVREMFEAPLSPRWAQLLGGKYYVSCGDSPAPAENYVFERNVEGCRLYSTAGARPRYFFGTEIGQSYTNGDEFNERLRRGDADIGKLSISTKDAPAITQWLNERNKPLDSEVLAEDGSANTLELDLKTSRNSVFVLNEFYRPDWQVTLNGRSQKIFQVNSNQLGILLPEGRNSIRFQYRPTLFVWLIYVQWATAGLLAAVLIWKSAPRQS
jgi:hypothetical protein